MTIKTEGRDRLHGGATPGTTHSPDCIGQDPLLGWFSLAKSSRINRQPKRAWRKGARK